MNIYTDGSSFSRPRRGGIGVRYIVINDVGDEEWIDECPPGYEQATNNQMELMACIVALKNIPAEMWWAATNRIYLFTDSQYVRDHVRYAQKWWPAQKWCNKDGRPIENVKLWKSLVREIKNAPSRVDIKWVKGHSKNKHNRAVDKLAKQSANGFLNEPLTVHSVRRKVTAESVSIGSVKLEGQELDIRIITDERMAEQRLWRYKYEVLPSDSPYAGLVDISYSEHLMRAAHSYRVVMGSDNKNPRIVKVIEELGLEESEAE